jgi:hypothetical protein
MITSEVDIFNLALNAVGTRSNISLPTEASREAEVCRRWYEPIRDRILRSAPWPSTKGFFRLPLLKARDGEESWVSDDPEPGFSYAYGVPSDMLVPRYLAGYQRFTLSSYPGDKLAINTNQVDALMCYTKRQVTIGLWDIGLQMAVVYGLAAYIAMPLQGKAQRAQLALNEANNLLMTAREGGANTDEDQRVSIPDWITVRGFGAPLSESRFYYPLDPLFSAGELGV